MKKLVMLLLVLGFCCSGVVLNAQVTEEPDFPMCDYDDGYDLIGQYEGGLMNDPNNTSWISDTYTFNLDVLECDSDLAELVVEGFAKEGHPESCSLGGDLPSDPEGCDQNQNYESFEVDVDGGTPFGMYTDNQGDGGVQNAWFPAGPWDTVASAGDDHELTFTHTQEGSGFQSVVYKVSLCAKCIDDDYEGCTPGYWRQGQHFDSWVGYLPGDFFVDVFGRSITVKGRPMGVKGGKPIDITNPTLLQALKANGGGINALARHAVAALLNAAAVNFMYSEGEVITMVQGAIDSGDIESIKNELAEQNELGCPLN